MYAAHIKQSKNEESKANSEASLAKFQQASTDNELFENLLEIAQHVRDSVFSDEDQRVVLETIGTKFLSRLLNTTCENTTPPHLYQSIALSIFSSLSVDSYVKSQVEVKDFLKLVNSILQHNSVDLGNPESLSLFTDCEEIVSNLAEDPISLGYLIECGTSEILLNYATSSQCQNPVPVLKSLSFICKSQGDTIFCDRVDQFHHMMSLIVDKIGQSSNLTEKAEYANILTTFLSGVSSIELSINDTWVKKLVQILNKFISIKMSPDDSDTVLFLVCALVSAVGSDVLKPDLVGSSSLIKAVVARVSVEVYMLLDCISTDNALERFLKLDKVFKLLSDLIQYLAEFGESTDPDSMIAIYKKLVDVSETIMEFLNFVWNQLVNLPKNHIIVLICVRTLAAMLSEITEEPTEQLLDLIPFFNFLCQNVEYPEDVVMEVKSATRAALENIRLIGITSSENENPEDSQQLSVDTKDQSYCVNISHNYNTPLQTDHSNSPLDSNGHLLKSANTDLMTDEGRRTYFDESDHKPSIITDKDANLTSRETEDHLGSSAKKQMHGDVNLSAETISKFRDYQELVSQFRSQPSLSLSRKVTFVKKDTSRGLSESEAEAFFWQPLPDDVLGYLIPFYGFLLDSQESLDVMVRNNCFSTLVSFIERSLSRLLENKSSQQPEGVTLNALSLVEQVYTNSPVTAAELECFQSFFEISVLSLPNLLSLSNPPPLVSLKLIEVCLTSYRLQMRGNKRNPLLQRLKHSQTRLFKAIIDYLSTFYTFRPGKMRPLMIYITKEYRDIWMLAEEIWCGSIAGLTVLLRSVEELQEVLLKSVLFPDFQDFLKEFDDEDVKVFPEDVQKIVDFMISFMESACESSSTLCTLILQYDGLEIAKQLKLKKLQRLLEK